MQSLLIKNLKYSHTKILCVLIILSNSCFLLTNQQFNFHEFGHGFHGRFHPFHNQNFGNANWGEPTSDNSRLNNGKWLNPGQELIFGTTTATPLTATVIVNGLPTNPTMVPFLPAATTPTPQFLDCFARCPTTSEHNPICASNRELYGNEQKFNCARRCGKIYKLYAEEAVKAYFLCLEDRQTVFKTIFQNIIPFGSLSDLSSNSVNDFF